ncbi:hypothetical protein Glove_227g61 [Diversispora epigaea]|uniref:SET domain-containing protein n=1 Tax=Diversispora epigaea TaxID=1348612 RepID=A0A397IE04_9GLOM|nr:hypothetical protein Glove_227g61 [Diversispora epigaea]
MRKNSSKIPKSWPSEIGYLTDNVFEPISLEPTPYKFPLSKDHSCHPFTSSLLLPTSIDPVMPSPFVKIKSLASQKDHPAYPENGLFAVKDLKEYSLILKYTGKVTTRIEGGEKGSDYELGFNQQFCIDGWRKGSEARFINDYRGIRPKPNVAFHEYIDSHSGKVKMGVWVIPGVGKIKKGEEIVVSYGKSFWKERGKSIN